MKKIIFICVLVSYSLIAESINYIAASNINIRSAPEVSDNISFVLNNGWQPIVILQEKKGDAYSWSEIKLSNNKIGWVVSKFISKIDDKDQKQLLRSYENESLKYLNKLDYYKLDYVYTFYSTYIHDKKSINSLYTKFGENKPKQRQYTGVQLAYYVGINSQYLLRVWNPIDKTSVDVLSMNVAAEPFFPTNTKTSYLWDEDILNSIFIPTLYGSNLSVRKALRPPLYLSNAGKKKKIDIERNDMPISFAISGNLLLITYTNNYNVSVYDLNTFQRVFRDETARGAFWITPSEKLISDKYKYISSFQDKLAAGALIRFGGSVTAEEFGYGMSIQKKGTGYSVSFSEAPEHCGPPDENIVSDNVVIAGNKITVIFSSNKTLVGYIDNNMLIYTFNGVESQMPRKF